jgi:hypothetical protein
MNGREEHRIQRQVLKMLIRWVFADLFVPLLRACFFVSEKESKSTSIVYFRKPIWNAIR